MILFEQFGKDSFLNVWRFFEIVIAYRWFIGGFPLRHHCLQMKQSQQAK